MIVMVFSMGGALMLGFLSGALTRAHTVARRVFCRCGVTRVCPLGHDDGARSAAPPASAPRAGHTGRPNAGHHAGNGAGAAAR